MPEQVSLAIIGGSGLYAMPGLKETREYSFSTPFGKPSAPIVVGTLEGMRVAFLARHGIGHHITPTEVPYRANIYALKVHGRRADHQHQRLRIVKEELPPGHIVIPEQIYDNTHGRARSFFGEGLVAHISVENPFCADTSDQLEAAVRSAGRSGPSWRHIHHHRRTALLDEG